MMLMKSIIANELFLENVRWATISRNTQEFYYCKICILIILVAWKHIIMHTLYTHAYKVKGHNVVKI